MKDVKTTGQVFTPRWVVRKILNICMYNGTGILGKHLMDNSCGDGAFLVAAVQNYCSAFFIKNSRNPESVERLREDLETYIHGLDIDADAVMDCINNLDTEAAKHGLYGLNWDVRVCDTLKETSYDCKMDYVVGNPPYVRVHNLQSSYGTVKSKFSFTKSGMTDLYLAFFEIGFRMLKPTGEMCYITPNSWFMSKAASEMRDYIKRSRKLRSIIDLGHEQVFDNATTYSVISHFKNDSHSNSFRFYTYNPSSNSTVLVDTLKYDTAFTDSGLILGTGENIGKVSRILNGPFEKKVVAKNGFATLCDDVFIGDDVPDSDFTIDVLKASTGKWTKCLYPYYCDGSLIPEDELFSDEEVRTYLESHKQELLKGRDEFPGWYAFGRMQAINDVCTKKVAVNCIVRDIDDIKIESVDEGEGVYSGFYILGMEADEVRRILTTQDFIDYVKSLRKYKRGGYYTFNTKDLTMYLNAALSSQID